MSSIASSAVFSQRSKGDYTYNRETSLEVEQLGRELQAAYESSLPALLAPSGMSAIASLLYTLQKRYTRVVYPVQASDETLGMIRSL
jgi:cystathionine beta-lyase/cystathionine gamma-synthase